MGGVTFCMRTKNEIRQNCKRRIFELAKDYITEASELIFESLISSEEYKNSESIFVYMSTTQEVDTEKIIAQALFDGKKVSVPKIIGTDIVPVKVSITTKFERNRFGILEPVDGMIRNTVDLCIVPLIAFDRKKSRLGHGGGYYDRYFSTYRMNKIALAFSMQEEQDIPMYENDIYMDTIITEKEFIR